MSSNTASVKVAREVAARAIVFRTRGSKHGPITRLVSPSDVGEMIKPFVFLDLIHIPVGISPGFNWHPHSGIATLTVVFNGSAHYEETTGVKGILNAGAVEWMRAGGGVWHTGKVGKEGAMKGFQLWVALPPELENVPAQSRYLNADEVPSNGPARVILGRYGTAESRLPAPGDMTYLDVRLKDGERWTYVPPPGHTVAWVAVHEGELRSPEPVLSGELAVFAERHDRIAFEAKGETRFVLGSAVKHPHPLVTGYYSVHTHQDALIKGEAEIERLGAKYRAEGVIR